jgi:molybdenum cofactor biosynthesis protein B
LGTNAHKKEAPGIIRAAIITASTTRSLDQDESGKWIFGQLKAMGHQMVGHQVIADDATTIWAALQKAVFDKAAQVVLINGGTGITEKDVTIEAVAPRFSKRLPAFGTLFAQLSFEEIGSAAILSRAVAGVLAGRAVVFCMPGSLRACRLACSRLIFPELGHLVKHLQD